MLALRYVSASHGGGQWGDCVIAILSSAILLFYVCSLRLHVCVASPCQTCAFRQCFAMLISNDLLSGADT